VGLPFQTHGVLLHLSMPSRLRENISAFSELCRSCSRHESAFVQFISLHGLHAHIVVHFLDGKWHIVLMSGSTVPLII